jgi:hypothetical protein
MGTGNEQYRVEILNRCPALEKLAAEEDINNMYLGNYKRKYQYFRQRETRL